MAMVELSCKGCRKPARADLEPSRLSQLLGWTQDRDGDWCVICQQQRTGDSVLQRAARARAGVFSDKRERAPTREAAVEPTPRAEKAVLVAFALQWMALSALLAAAVIFVLALLGAS